jgi:catecholate siderophore receptor
VSTPLTVILVASLIGNVVHTPQDTLRAANDTLRTAKDSARATALTVVKVAGERVRSRYLPAISRSATRTATPLHQLPQSLTALSAPLLADLAVHGMAKAVEYVPGVTMGQGEGHRDAPSIRGQSSTADFFVDGVRDDAQYLRDSYNVAQLDALKGSAAAVFGRGGGGGVINRVMKQADWQPLFVARAETGSWQQRRVTVDVNRPLHTRAAIRINALHERDASFRREVGVERNGINPTLSVLHGNTMLQAGAEWFDDRRTVDRGQPSRNGGPALLDVRAFVGDPTQSRARMAATSAFARAEHAFGNGLTWRTHLRAFDYDKDYQNVFATSAVDSMGRVTLGGYGDAVQRRSLFNQTDVTWSAAFGRVRHVLLAGTELSRQRTQQARRTAYFDNVSTARMVPVATATVTAPVTFRPSATDASNDGETTVAAAFMQEQLHLGDHAQLLAGVRADRFAVDVTNRRTSTTFARTDRLFSPRAALLLTPTRALSLYGSWSVAHLPGSGDQFTSLTITTQALQPEQFRNREIGFKWQGARALDITGAYFQLERSNTVAPDPLDATRMVQTGRQRTQGAELGVQGSPVSGWDIMGGVAVQQARIVSRTSSARAGATSPLVPHTTASLWNKVRVHAHAAAGVGVVHQGRRYAAIDNSVTLPSFTRLDAALFVDAPLGMRAQLNVENVLDRRYTATSHGNNNIMPGAPRTLRLSLAVTP